MINVIFIIENSQNNFLILKLILNPLISSCYTDDVDYPTRWVNYDYAVVGALGYSVESAGNLKLLPVK